MDDAIEKLNSLLSSPQGQEQIRNIAASFSNGTMNVGDLMKNFSKASDDQQTPDLSAIGKLAPLLGNISEGDKNTQLLTALKPHLSRERQDKIDQAIKLIRLINILPALQQSGLLNGIL